MLRMPVQVQVEGKGEKYSLSIPANAYKEDLKQVVEDGMHIHNCNFVQLAKLVRSLILCNVLGSLPSYCFILMRSFVGCYGYPEHKLSASRVPDSVEGCREVVALRPIDRF